MCQTIFLCLFPYVLHQTFKEHQKIAIHKRVIHDTNLTAFKADLCNINWDSINQSPETISKYETFLKIFSDLYEKHFP